MDINYLDDYYSYFDQLGMDTGSYTTATPRRITVSGDSDVTNLETYMNKYIKFSNDVNNAVTEGIDRDKPFIIDNPYRLGYLAYLINYTDNISNEDEIPYDKLHYQLTGSLMMTDRLWEPIKNFSGTFYASDEILGQIGYLDLRDGGFFRQLTDAHIINITFNYTTLSMTDAGVLSGVADDSISDNGVYLDRVVMRNTVATTNESYVLTYVQNLVINQSIFAKHDASLLVV